MVYMWGHVSGAHYNPAATVWLLVRKKIGTHDAVMYIISQILGALVAVRIAAMITGTGFVPAPGEWVTTMQWFIVEALFTFALVSVILHTAATKATSGNSYYWAAIWCTVLAAAFAWGHISWGAFNPAVWLGPWIYDVIWGNGFSHVWMLYVLAPVIGWVVAWLLHGYIVWDE